jgi:hypothetical protein
MAYPSDAGASAAIGELRALLGPNVTLCDRDPSSTPGAPSHPSRDCCDDCPLHRFGGASSALVLPIAGFAGPTGVYSERLRISSEPDVVGRRRVAFAQPRAPPARR